MHLESHETSVSSLESRIHIQSSREMKRKRPEVIQPRLSEGNLAQHDKVCAMTNDVYGESTIYQERARVHEECMHRDRYGQLDNVPEGFRLAPESANTQSPPSVNYLKLYASQRPSSESPLCRYLFPSPVTDAQPWLAREMMSDSGISPGDLESLELRRLAGEYLHDENEDDVDGSLYASPPTLSLSQAHKAMKEKRWKDCTRVRKSQRMRRAPVPKTAQDPANMEG